MTTISSASSSASSRYWVVSSSVVPPAASDRMMSHIPIRGPRVQAGGRLVEEEHPGLADQAGGQVEPALHAAGVGLGRPVGGIEQAELLEQLGRAAAGLRLAQVEQAADRSPGSPGR